MTHGVVASEADLIYADEPGAANEALADLFGTLIEYHGDPGKANWVLGERYPGLGSMSPVRSMADPHLMAADGKSLFQRSKPYGPDNRGQPDHYGDYANREDLICETTSDYFTGCVHFNSGIMNKLFFLAAEGGRHRGIVVKGIGREKIGRIAYRALVAYVNPSSGLTETADLMRAACSDLAENKAVGVVAEDCDRIRDAQTAVSACCRPATEQISNRGTEEPAHRRATVFLSLSRVCLDCVSCGLVAHLIEGPLMTPVAEPAFARPAPSA